MKTKYVRKYYTLRIMNQKFKLVYKIKKYKELEIQSKDLKDINNLISKWKLQGRKFSFFQENQKWYELLEEKIIPIQTRYNILNKIFETIIIDKYLEDYINYRWQDNCHKQTSSALIDLESAILDTMGSYLLAGYEDNNIIDANRQEVIYKKECFSFIDETYENIVENKSKKKEDKTFKVGKLQSKRWKSTATYRGNKLFNHYDDEPEIMWDWINEKWVTIQKEKKNHSSIIDFKRKYSTMWCIVDNNNMFLYNNIKYKICEKNTGYKLSNSKLLMDSILVVEQDGLHFFNIKLQEIPKRDIIIVH